MGRRKTKTPDELYRKVPKILVPISSPEDQALLKRFAETTKRSKARAMEYAALQYIRSREASGWVDG